MKESEYILVSNLTKARAAEGILRDMLVSDRAWRRRAKAIVALDSLIELLNEQVDEMEEG